MTIASEITRINNNIASAYTECNSKGATMPQARNSANLATCISSIPAGGGGGSFESITREVVNGVYQVPSSSFTFSLPSTAISMGSQVMYYAFYQCAGITSADMSSLTSLSNAQSLYYAFYMCSNLTSINLSNLASISGDGVMQYTFYDCAGLTSVDLSSLATVSGTSSMYYTFYNCTNLVSVDLSGLTSVEGNGYNPMTRTFYNTGLTTVNLNSLTTLSAQGALSSTFENCTSLTSVDLSRLTTITGRYGMYCTFSGCTNLTSVDLTNLSTISGSQAFQRTFNNCTSLTSLSFPSLNSNSFGSDTNQFDGMLNGVSGCTVHFPSNLQSVIGSWSDVTAGFGGTDTTVLFDLPATT